MATEDHERLVCDATAGDAASIDALLERHLPGLLAYVRQHVGGAVARREPPLDLAQSVCREVLEHAASFEYRGEGQFRHWLYRMALAEIRDRERYWRALKRTVARERGGASFAPCSCDGSPSDLAIREEDLQRLAKAFERLPPAYRQVITLAYVVGLSRRKIAAEMNRSEGAVRVMLHRARARVGFLLGDPRVVGCDPMQDADGRGPASTTG